MDALPIPIGLGLVVVLLLLNALFVASEFAYVTVRRTQMRQFANEGNPSARLVLRALGNLDYYVAASQLGITMASIALGYLGEPVIARLIEPPIEELVGSFAPALSHTVAVAFAFTFITALHIVFGEFVPKSVALQRPAGTSLWLALPMQVFVRLFGPLVWLLNATGNGLLRLLGLQLNPIGDQPLSPEELSLTLESSASAGLISRRELSLARNTLSLSTISAADLMVPRGEVVGLPENATWEEVIRTFATHRFTRYPVYREHLDHIRGVVNAKDVVLNRSTGADWRVSIRPALILPESITVEQALSAARSAGEVLVILADEFGGTAGIISVFDIVEFLAGELPNEYQSASTEVRGLPDGTLVLSGLTHLVELQSDLGIDIPGVEAHTLGGLIVELLNRIPKEGDEVQTSSFTARVLAMDGHRVDRVLLTPIATDEEQSNEQ
jgi:putative hemolysin